jgi:aryl-alcohol dehydrogenase-like predicted oxidoreductase
VDLVLGTVQFGLDYGITNAGGRVSAQDVARILDAAAARGVTQVDTAAAYGDSERVLGHAGIAARPFKIVTKLPKVPDGVTGAAARAFWEQAFETSLRNLGVAAVDGLMAHTCADLLGPDGDVLWSYLESLKASGRVRLIGASVYDGADIDALLARYTPGLVQLPYSLLDQRLRTSGHLQTLARRNVVVHARSVFLQGLLLADPSAVPAGLSALVPHLNQIRRFAKTNACDMAQLALLAVHKEPTIAGAVIGVTSLAEFNQIADAWANLKIRSDAGDLTAFGINEPRLIDPRLWPRTAQ